MELTILGSSSSANGYILQNNHEALILECGCDIDDAILAINRNASVLGVLISHEHGDHSRNIESYIKYFNIYCSEGTAKKVKYENKSELKIIKSLNKLKLGNFSILPFETYHDCEEPLGFYITHPEIGALLFATDTRYLRYKFPFLTNIMIECNYSDEILKENVEKGIIHPYLEKRIIHTHMSLDTCKKTLLENDISKVNNVILLHLSSKNSNPEQFKSCIEYTIRKKVYIAQKGLKLTI